MEKETKMQELVKRLNEAADAYYNHDKEIMSNFEYDKLYDELLALEKETGITLPDSPTVRAGYEVVDGLVKEEHETPALSLDKTKSVKELKEWLGNRGGMMSWKMDGLTVVVTYSGGTLQKAVTRGNGYIGENITHNARYFNGLPQNIPFTGKIVIRGEAVITYSEFSRINETLEKQYENPRNLASGTVRSFDSRVCAERKIDFFAFQVVDAPMPNSFMARLNMIKDFGIQTVDFEPVYTGVEDEEYLDKMIRKWESKIKDNDFPTDGLVLEYDDIEYGESLGSTGHHPRYGMAFKWQDEVLETYLEDIEWSASRTGLLNPVAIFRPVRIEGTTVTRASVHNVSVMDKYGFHKGDKIGVYKANMIIPQIAWCEAGENGNGSADLLTPPAECPVCGCSTAIKESADGIKTLWCRNSVCPAKKIGMFERFADRDAMNIEGLSTATLRTFIQAGFLHNPSDLYRLDLHKDTIEKMEGFGEKSFKKLWDAIQKSRVTTFERYLYAMGIPEIGRSQSKEVKKYLQTLKSSDSLWTSFMRLLENGFDFAKIEGFGMVLNQNLYNWFNSGMDEWEEDLVSLLTFEKEVPDTVSENWVTGKTFVVTGDVHTYKNRNELKAFIESCGGKVSGSVSKKTDFLINNDLTSTSGKNQKAKELGIPIISEDDFNRMAV